MCYKLTRSFKRWSDPLVMCGWYGRFKEDVDYNEVCCMSSELISTLSNEVSVANDTMNENVTVRNLQVPKWDSSKNKRK